MLMMYGENFTPLRFAESDEQGGPATGPLMWLRFKAGRSWGSLSGLMRAGPLC